ncbi:MAG: hypothetical protein CMF09_09205 [Idiomarina sp.]|nr:hypothetical protein [Idiomarina sp.]
MHDIVDIALTIAPDQYEQIITMAIEAEPAYIDDVVSLAAKHHPQRLDEIIRVAISSEPQLSNSVIHSAAISAPDSFISAIMSTLTTLPDATVNILTAMKDFLSGEQSETNKIKISNTEEQWQVFIRQSKNQGVTKEEMRWFQKQGYITEKQLATVYIDSAE